jgi:hypothetical protein
MCEDKAQPAKLLIVKSVTELTSGKKCCSVNNGRSHRHLIRAENQRREYVHIKGNVSTRSATKQFTFTHGLHTKDDWDVDFLAYGQQTSAQQAEIKIGAVHSPGEDIEALLEYAYDDPFGKVYQPFTLTIPVIL